MLPPLRPLATALTLALAQGPDAEPRAAPAGPQAPPPGPPSTPAPESSPGPKPDQAAAAKKGETPEEEGWIDIGHAFIEHRIFAPVLRFDRFFSDERDLDAERSRSFLRWRNEVRFSEDLSRPIFATGVHANLRLPGLNKQLRRLRIVIAGQTRDAFDTLFPQRTGPLAGEEEDTLGTPNAGLRFYLLDSLLSHADLGAGVLTRIPPGAYGQVRFRLAIPVGKLFLTRSVMTGFWRTDTRFGTSAGLELARPLDGTFIARLSGSGTLTERSQGVEWASELALLAFIGPHRAAQLGLSVNGASQPRLASDGVTRPPHLDRFRLYTRLRRDVWRRWVFVEIEPELAWPWTLERRRHPAWGAALRLELQFQGKEAPAPPPPAPPPEPEDPAPPDALPKAPAPGAPGGRGGASRDRTSQGPSNNRRALT